MLGFLKSSYVIYYEYEYRWASLFHSNPWMKMKGDILIQGFSQEDAVSNFNKQFNSIPYQEGDLVRNYNVVKIEEYIK